MESNLLKAETRGENMEKLAIKVRSQYGLKLRSLQKVVQDLRRQYSGSIPLLKQEKLSNNLVQINLEKQRISSLLHETESKLKSMEKEKEEMDLKRRGIDEVLKTLKHGSGTKQVLEWHSKLEDLRLKELHARRNAEQWEKEVKHLKDLENSTKSRNEQLEEELVRLETMMEQKQMEWETHEIELEKIDIQNLKLEIGDNSLGESQNLPSNDLPLAQQLETSLVKNKGLNQQMNSLKKKLDDSRKGFEDLCKKNRELENQLLGKDRMINDLRQEIPASVDRAVAISSVIGQPGIPSACLPFNDNVVTMSIAQDTIDSLRERLKIKEETIAKYEQLLKQSNSEHAESMQRRQQEMNELNRKLREQQTAYNELRSSRIVEDLTSSDTVHQYVTRAQDLEDEVQELQDSLGNVSTELATAKAENGKIQKMLDYKNNEVASLKEIRMSESNSAENEMKKEIMRVSNELSSYQEENMILKEENKQLSDAQTKAPSIAMKSLVDRLRNDLSEKEKKNKALSRVIADLKNEMLSEAEKSMITAEKPGQLQSLIDKETRSYQSKIDEQIQLIDKLKRQNKIIKESESKISNEVTRLKELVEKKSSMILKLREEKVSSRSVKSGARQNNDEEKEDLKSQVKNLEEKLKKLNHAEKPLEDENESKVIKNAEEVARWDEKKKWQKKLDELKRKLKDADEEVSKISKQNDSLRETVSRLDREKFQLDMKWKSHVKIGTSKSSVADSRMNVLQAENDQLKNKVSDLEHKATMEQDPGVETFKLRIKFLQDRVEQQEKKISLLEISKKGGTEALMKEVEILKKKESSCQKAKGRLEESNTDQKLKLETTQHNLIVLREECTELRKVAGALRVDATDATMLDRLHRSVRSYILKFKTYKNSWARQVI